jgi:uncharacterized membrane protein YeaQ/YmgE (transglycosylase-associated protein family)
MHSRGNEFYSDIVLLNGETTMNILAWIVLGLVAGAIAKAIYPGHQSGGILGTLILGVIGAFVGGSLYNLVTTGTISLAATGLSIGGIVVAVIGAIIALWIYYALGRRSAL